MKKSSMIFVSGILAAIAMALQVFREVFFVLGGYAVLSETFVLSSGAIAKVLMFANVLVWGLVSAAFTILANDKKNFVAAIVGGVAGSLFVLLSVVIGVWGTGHWLLFALWPMFFAAYSFAVVFLKTAVPSGLRNLAVIAVWILFLQCVWFNGVFISANFIGWGAVAPFYDAYTKIARWPGILCWAIMLVHFICQVKTSKSGLSGCGAVWLTCDAICSTCGAKIHFEPNQMRVLCGQCGTPSTRISGEYSHQAVPARQAIVANTMEVECPKCGGKCEIPTEINEGQHLLCPYCGEKFSYHVH